MKFGKFSIVALAAASIAVAAPAFAKHYSNTLSKIGHTLQYGVRKDTNNLSIDTHRALGHKSVEHRRYGHYRRNVVITSGGHVKPVYHNGHPSHFMPAHTNRY